MTPEERKAANELIAQRSKATADFLSETWADCVTVFVVRTTDGDKVLISTEQRDYQVLNLVTDAVKINRARANCEIQK